MPTLYSDIYGLFTSKITDYSFVDFTDVELEDIFSKYLRTAIVKFDSCKQALQDRDETLKQFNLPLTDIEKEILSSLMVVQWVSVKVNDVKNMKNVLTDRDFNLYSPANHLKQLIELKNSQQAEVDRLIVKYTYMDLRKP